MSTEDLNSNEFLKEIDNARAKHSCCYCGRKGHIVCYKYVRDVCAGTVSDNSMECTDGDDGTEVQRHPGMYTDDGEAALLAWDCKHPGQIYLEDLQGDGADGTDTNEQEGSDTDISVEFGTCELCDDVGIVGTLCTNCLDTGMIYTRDPHGYVPRRNLKGDELDNLISTKVREGVLRSTTETEIKVFFEVVWYLDCGDRY